MTDLTREHCWKLKDWGMPQELEYGDWCWVPVTDVTSLLLVTLTLSMFE